MPTDLLGAPVRFEDQVVLTRTEAFWICQVLAGAEAALVTAGRPAEGRRLDCLFRLVEDRLSGGEPAQPWSGSNSRESELMQ